VLCGGMVAAGGSGGEKVEEPEEEIDLDALLAGNSLRLPINKLQRKVEAGKIPMVLVSCGSFSPPTHMHTRILEDARDVVDSQGKYSVIGGYLVPVNDAYGKSSLAAQHHRLAMTKLAVEHSSWLMADSWEVDQDGWTRTAVSLNRLKDELADVAVEVGGKAAELGLIEVRMVCGADLLESFPVILDDGRPLWAEEDQQLILAKNGVCAITRQGTDLDAVINTHEILRDNRSRIVQVELVVENNISSTVVRNQLVNGRSIKYFVEDGVSDYIDKHNLAALPQWQPKK